MTDTATPDRAELERQAHALVRELPVLFEANGFPQWMAAPRKDLDHRPYDLVHQPSGARIWCRFDNGKIEFHPTWPSDEPEGPGYMAPRDWGVTGHGEKFPTAVYCDPKRGAPAVARDVARRLLTDFLPMWEKCLEARRVRRNDRSLTHTTADILTRELDPYVWTKGRQDNPDRVQLHNAPGALYGEFKVNSADSVEIHLRGTPGLLALEVARAVTAFLRRNKR